MYLKFNENDIVEKEEIAKVIKCLMEGEEGKGIGERMMNLKHYAANALKDGPSTQNLSQLASHWEYLEQNRGFSRVSINWI